MRIPLERQSTTPLYRQIEDHLRRNILAGSLPEGTRLPATRQLADELGVSRITVKNAYAELESAGLVAMREGSGTYVLSPSPNPRLLINTENFSWPRWQLDATLGDEENPPVTLQPRSSHPQPVAFTGVGDPRQFPLKDFYKALQTVIRRDGVSALTYGDFNAGYVPLRETITHILASQGIQTRAENVLITSGSQQALALVCQTLLKPGDVVLVESPTYNLALDLFRALGLKVVGVPIDDQGLRIDLLEEMLPTYYPRLIYTIPNFQNPSGACLSIARRREMLMLAERYNIPILEDDFVGDLRYDGRAQPAIKALDPGGRVIYIGTFSKMLMPGLRVGYLLADGPIFKRLARHKRVGDLTTSTLMQRTLNEYVSVGRYQKHLQRSCRIYRKRRDAMLAAIRKYLPTVQVDPPQGGLFLWLRLKGDVSSSQLLAQALKEGVEFAPGTRFFPNPAEGEPYLRLNFAVRTPDEIELGVRRLAMALQTVNLGIR